MTLPPPNSQQVELGCTVLRGINIQEWKISPRDLTQFPNLDYPETQWGYHTQLDPAPDSSTMLERFYLCVRHITCAAVDRALYVEQSPFPLLARYIYDRATSRLTCLLYKVTPEDNPA